MQRSFVRDKPPLGTFAVPVRIDDKPIDMWSVETPAGGVSNVQTSTTDTTVWVTWARNIMHKLQHYRTRLATEVNNVQANASAPSSVPNHHGFKIYERTRGPKSHHLLPQAERINLINAELVEVTRVMWLFVPHTGEWTSNNGIFTYGWLDAPEWAVNEFGTWRQCVMD